jgi:hypothetical protein
MSTKFTKKIVALTAVSFLPQMASAAIFTGCESKADGTIGSCTFAQVVDNFIAAIVKPIVPFIIGLTVIYFLWGVTMYIKNGASEDERDAGKQKMVYGIIALAVMLSFWGLAAVIMATFFG